jgi:hypothetical protein
MDGVQGNGLPWERMLSSIHFTSPSPHSCLALMVICPAFSAHQAWVLPWPGEGIGCINIGKSQFPEMELFSGLRYSMLSERSTWNLNSGAHANPSGERVPLHQAGAVNQHHVTDTAFDHRKSPKNIYPQSLWFTIDHLVQASILRHLYLLLLDTVLLLLRCSRVKLALCGNISPSTQVPGR